MTLLAVTAGAVYLVLRAFTLGGGWQLMLSVPLYGAELAAYIQFCLFAVAAHQARETSERAPRKGVPAPAPTDLVVRVGGRSVEQLEQTLIGIQAVEWVGDVIVIADRRCDEVDHVSAMLGARSMVDDRAGRAWIEVLFGATTSPHVGWLDAGDVPAPDFVHAAGSRFSDPSVGVWQSPIGLFNRDSFAHIQRGRDEDAVVRTVIAPGLDRLGAAPWTGSGSVLRRAAFEQHGRRRAAGVMMADALVTLHRAGWTSATDAEIRVRTTAHDTLDDYLRARRLRAVHNFALLRGRPNPILDPGATLRQRLGYLTLASLHITGIRQLAVVAVVAATLVSGTLPVAGNLTVVAAAWGMTTLAVTAARRMLAAGSMRVGDWSRHGWRTLGADLTGLLSTARRPSVARIAERPSVTGLHSLGRLRLVTLAVLVLDVALLARGMTIAFESALPRFTTFERVTAVAFAVFLLVPMLDVLQLIVARKQRRRSVRIDVTLDVTIGDSITRTLDLSASGVGLLLPYSPPVGSEQHLRLELPGATRSPEVIDLRGVVRATSSDASGQIRVGLEFIEPHAHARQSLVRFCMSAADGPAGRSEVVEPHDLVIARRVTQRAHSVRVLTALASVASLAFVTAGPASVSASTDLAAVGSHHLRLVDVDGNGLGGAAVRLFIDGDGRWEAVGQTSAEGDVTFEAPTDVGEQSDASTEIRWNGARLVIPLRGDATEVTAGRIEFGGVPVVAIDTGSGWQPNEGFTDLLPGWVALRLADGTVLKTELQPGFVFDVSSRSQDRPTSTPTTTAPEAETTSLVPAEEVTIDDSED